MPLFIFKYEGLQLGKLAGEVLGVGRDAGVAVNHARRSATELCNREAQSVQWSRFVANILIFAIRPCGAVR